MSGFHPGLSTPQQAAQLDFETFSAFARSHHYPQPKRLLLNYARLQQPQPIPAAETVQALQDEAVQLCQLVKMLVQRKGIVPYEHANQPESESYKVTYSVIRSDTHLPKSTNDLEAR